MFRLLTYTTKFAKQQSYLKDFKPQQMSLKYGFFSKKENKPIIDSKNKEEPEISQEGLQLARKVIVATGAAVTATHIISIASIYTAAAVFFPVAGIIGLRALYKLEKYRIQEYMKEEDQSKLDTYSKKTFSLFQKFFKNKDGKQELPSQKQKYYQFGLLLGSLGVFASFPLFNYSSLLIFSPALFFSTGYLMSKRIKDEDDIEDSTFWALKNVGLPNYLLNAALGGLSFLATGNVLFFDPYMSLILCGFWSWVLAKTIQGSYIHQSMHKKYDLLYLTLLPFEYSLLMFL